MNLHEVRSGYLYAIKTRTFWLEPFIAIDTPNGLRFLLASEANIEISSDGPFEISDELADMASSKGLEFREDQICNLWSERFSSDILNDLIHSDSDKDNFLADGSVNWEKRTNQPSETLSNWLRSSEDWPGSSSSVFYDSDGKFSGSFVTLFTGNPYQLAVLLTWLGVPEEIIKGITGIEPS